MPDARVEAAIHHWAPCIVPWTEGERLTKAAQANHAPVEFLLLDDRNHVANNRGYRWRSQSADWIAR